jgi:hypothetical protein
MVKIMHHNEYMARMKVKTTAELEYIRTDANDALNAHPRGINAGYYADEVHYANMELTFRAGPAMYLGE